MKRLLLLGVCLLLLAGATADDRMNEHSHCNFDILILLDGSGSIEDNQGTGNFNMVKTFAIQLISDIDEESTVGDQTRVGVFSYSNKVIEHVDITSSQSAQEINNTITNNVTYQGSVTKMYEAITVAEGTFSTTKRTAITVTQVLILFTDGVPHSDERGNSETFGNVMRVLNRQMDREIIVILVGVHNFNETMLNMVSQHDTFGYAFTANDFSELSNPTFPQRITNALMLNCNCLQDFYMLVDSSGSIGRELFDNYVKAFSINMVDAINEKFPIGSHADGTRLGVATFSTRSATLMGLTAGTSVGAIKDAIGIMTFADSWTYLVRYAREASDILKENRRRGVPMRLVLITDGVPTAERAENAGETKSHLIALIEELNRQDIKTTIFGFMGDKSPQGDIDEVFSGYGEISNLYVSKGTNEERFTLERARQVVRAMDATCPSRELLKMCPTSRPTELAILLDDTNAGAWDESKALAKTIVNQLIDYELFITIVTSQGYNRYEPGFLDRLEYSQPQGMNLLMKALGMARQAFGAPNILVSTGPFRVVLAIHSGHLDFDVDINDNTYDTSINSLKQAAYVDLKAKTVQIHSLPLLSASIQGKEVLRRIHSQPGPMLSAQNLENYPQLLENLCTQIPEQSCEYTDVALLVDVSHSSDIVQVKAQVKAVLESLKQSESAHLTNVALVTFSEYASIHYDLEAGQIGDANVYTELVNAVDSISMSPHSMTNLAYGLNIVTHLVFRNHGDRLPGDAPNHIVIFSDLQVNTMTRGDMNTSSAVSQAMDVANVIWVRPLVMIDGMYSDTGFKNMMAEVDAASAVEQLIEQACQKGPLDLVRCPTEQLLILVDSSGSARDFNYNDVRNFAADLVMDFLNVAPDATLSVAFYSDGIRNVDTDLIPYDTYTNSAKREAMITKIRTHKLLGGRTDVSRAFYTAVSQARATNKDTSKLRVVLIADGESNMGEPGGTFLRSFTENGANNEIEIYAVFYMMKYKQNNNINDYNMFGILPAVDELKPPEDEDDDTDDDEAYEEFEPLNTQENRDWVMRRLESCPP